MLLVSGGLVVAGPAMGAGVLWLDRGFIQRGVMFGVFLLAASVPFAFAAALARASVVEARVRRRFARVIRGLGAAAVALVALARVVKFGWWRDLVSFFTAGRAVEFMVNVLVILFVGLLVAALFIAVVAMWTERARVD